MASSLKLVMPAKAGIQIMLATSFLKSYMETSQPPQKHAFLPDLEDSIPAGLALLDPLLFIQTGHQVFMDRPGQTRLEFLASR